MGPQASSPLLPLLWGWLAALPWPCDCPWLGHAHLCCACDVHQ